MKPERVCWWLLLATVAFLTALSLATDSFEGRAVDWFNAFGAWLAGIGAIAACCVALFLSKSERRLKDQELHKMVVLERTRIYCWVIFEREIDARTSSWKISINNLSICPVATWSFHLVLTTDSKPKLSRYSFGTHPLPPGLFEEPFEVTRVDGTLHCEFYFVDAAGDCWCRHSNGRLIAVDNIAFENQSVKSFRDANSRRQFQQGI